ncbi:class I SAM-dependent methyltransferase [Chloroflexota bacterium]
MKQKARLMPLVSERLAEDLIVSRRLIKFEIGKYAFAGQFVKDKIVLDLGCAGGYGSSYLMTKGAKKVVGVDISKDAVENARAYHENDGLYFLLSDVQQLPFHDNFFDVIVALEIIEHLERVEDFLNECSRVLKDGGTFICSTPNKGVGYPNVDKPSNPYHVKEFYIEELHQLLSQYLENINLCGYMHYKAGGNKEKLIGMMKSLLFSLPIFFQTAIIKFVALVTSFIFRGYRPTIMRDIDEEEFDSMLTADSRPFPIQGDHAAASYIFAVGEKKGGKFS